MKKNEKLEEEKEIIKSNYEEEFSKLEKNFDQQAIELNGFVY